VHRHRTFYDEGVFVGRHSLHKSHKQWHHRSFPFWVAAVLAMGCVLARSTSAAPDTHAADYVHLADLIVNRSWKLEPGERVVMFWDAKRDPGIALPLRAAIQRAGGQVEEIAAPESASDAKLTPAARAARFEQWKPIFQRSQAAIWLPSDLTAVRDQPFEHLVEASTVRSIHFHWFLPPDPAEVPLVETMYERAIDVTPAVVGKRLAALEQALRGRTVHVTAQNGTDLVFHVPQNAHFHRNTGEATKEKVREARSVRDREEELPASVLRTTELADARGTFTGYLSFDTRSTLARATLGDGRVTALEALRGPDAEVAAWKSAKGDKGKPGEFVISANTALAAVLKSGFMPYYGYGAGVVRLAIGDNWESGGHNRSSNGELLLFLPGATLSVDGRDLIRNGELIDR
jgi:aminopeptidase